MGSLTKSQTFSPDWPELGLIKAEEGKTWEKCGFQEPGVVTQFLCTVTIN